MCLYIIPKSELSEKQLHRIATRILDPEHIRDNGPPRVWHIYENGLFAVVHKQTNEIIGLVEASGDKDSVSPGWWIDAAFRKKGYGYMLVDTLAEYLKCQGFTGAGKAMIPFNSEGHDLASQKLDDRFQSRF
jgi:hypothetical protein